MTEEFKKLFRDYTEARRILDSLSCYNTHGKSIDELAEMDYQYKQAAQWASKCKRALDKYEIV